MYFDGTLDGVFRQANAGIPGRLGITVADRSVRKLVATAPMQTPIYLPGGRMTGPSAPPMDSTPSG